MKNLIKTFIAMLALSSLPAVVNADAISRKLTPEDIEKRDKETLSKMGLEMLDGEVKIIPFNRLIAKELKNSKDGNFFIEKMKKYMAMYDEQQKNGYINESEPRAKELLELKNIAPYQYKKYSENTSPTATHLRHSTDELKMAYTYIGVPTNEMDELIGVAPYGAYKQKSQGDGDNGWDGAVQFFDKKELGSCAFSEHNMKLAHSGAELIKELTSYEIHGKPTIILVKGNKETGYLYKISWYDYMFSRDLECANKNYEPELLAKTIELANRIDSYQQPS